MRTAGFWVLLATLSLGSGPAPVAIAQTAPAAPAQVLSPGVTRLTNAALAYRPAQLAEPAAVVVLLHGAGDKADRFLKEFTKFADERGNLLLALESKDARRSLAHRPARLFRRRKPRFVLRSCAAEDVSRDRCHVTRLCFRTPPA